MDAFTFTSEAGFLTCKIIVMLGRYLLDSCLPRLELNMSTISQTFQNAKDIEWISPQSTGGAGGHGTERGWVTVETADGEIRHLFGKSATRNFSESFFLNLFDVYSNELRFYKFLKTMTASSALPPQFFPVVYAARSSYFQTSFLLLIENVDKTRSEPNVTVSFPSLSSQTDHPLMRVLAVLDTQASLHAEFFQRPPACVWNQHNRPRFLQLIAQTTLRDVEARFPNIMAPSVARDYRLFLRYYEVIRHHWDAGNITLVHGDAHLGNYFFEEEVGGEVLKARMYDFQCTAHEHPIRDVAYHIMCSVDEHLIKEFGGDKKLLQYYLDKFNANLRKRNSAAEPSLRSTVDTLDLDEAWSQYRMHAFWCMAAFVISAGAGEKLFEGEKAQFLISRISRGCERIDAGGELRAFLVSKNVKF